MEQLTASLRSQRRLLDTLLFRLLAVRGLLIEDDTRYLPLAAAELERAAAAVREHEWPRTAVVEAAAARHRVTGPELTIAAIARHAPAPYPHVLDEDRRALRALLTDIDVTASEARALARLGLDRGEAERAASEHERGRDDREPDDGWDRELARLAYQVVLVACAGFPLPRLRAVLR